MLAKSTPWIVCGIIAAIVFACGATLVSRTSAPTTANIVATVPVYTPITFKTLSGYVYKLGAPLPAAPPERGILSRFMSSKAQPKSQIPSTILKLNNQAISIQGFMIPLALKHGTTDKFLLMKNTSFGGCWGGPVPSMNDWISVTMKPGTRARVLMDKPVTVTGTLLVGEEIKGGETLSIYRMEAVDVEGPLDL